MPLPLETEVPPIISSCSTALSCSASSLDSTSGSPIQQVEAGRSCTSESLANSPPAHDRLRLYETPWTRTRNGPDRVEYNLTSGGNPRARRRRSCPRRCSGNGDDAGGAGSASALDAVSEREDEEEGELCQQHHEDYTGGSSTSSSSPSHHGGPLDIACPLAIVITTSVIPSHPSTRLIATLLHQMTYLDTRCSSAEAAGAFESDLRSKEGEPSSTSSSPCPRRHREWLSELRRLREASTRKPAEQSPSSSRGGSATSEDGCSSTFSSVPDPRTCYWGAKTPVVILCDGLKALASDGAQERDEKGRLKKRETLNYKTGKVTEEDEGNYTLFLEQLRLRYDCKLRRTRREKGDKEQGGQENRGSPDEKEKDEADVLPVFDYVAHERMCERDVECSNDLHEDKKLEHKDCVLQRAKLERLRDEAILAQFDIHVVEVRDRFTHQNVGWGTMLDFAMHDLLVDARFVFVSQHDWMLMRPVPCRDVVRLMGGDRLCFELDDCIRAGADVEGGDHPSVVVKGTGEEDIGVESKSNFGDPSFCSNSVFLDEKTGKRKVLINYVGLESETQTRPHGGAIGGGSGSSSGASFSGVGGLEECDGGRGPGRNPKPADQEQQEVFLLRAARRAWGPSMLVAGLEQQDDRSAIRFPDLLLAGSTSTESMAMVHSETTGGTSSCSKKTLALAPAALDLEVEGDGDASTLLHFAPLPTWYDKPHFACASTYRRLLRRFRSDPNFRFIEDKFLYDANEYFNRTASGAAINCDLRKAGAMGAGGVVGLGEGVRVDGRKGRGNHDCDSRVVGPSLLPLEATLTYGTAYLQLSAMDSCSEMNTNTTCSAPAPAPPAPTIYHLNGRKALLTPAPELGRLLRSSKGEEGGLLDGVDVVFGGKNEEDSANRRSEKNSNSKFEEMPLLKSFSRLSTTSSSTKTADFRRDFTYYQKGASKNNAKGKVDFKQQCWECQEIGHSAANCPKRAVARMLGALEMRCDEVTMMTRSC